MPHTAAVRVTSQYRVDAPLAWVRQFLVHDTAEADRTLDGDTVVVRQSNTFLHLTVTNHLSQDAAATVLDIDADLRLRGLGWLAGSLFRRRLRRTLERSLDGLPHAIEVALEQADQRAALDATDRPFEAIKHVAPDLDRSVAKENEAREDRVEAKRSPQ